MWWKLWDLVKRLTIILAWAFWGLGIFPLAIVPNAQLGIIRIAGSALFAWYVWTKRNTRLANIGLIFILAAIVYTAVTNQKSIKTGIENIGWILLFGLIGYVAVWLRFGGNSSTRTVNSEWQRTLDITRKIDDERRYKDRNG